MYRLLICSSILQLIACVCPNSYELVVDGQCWLDIGMTTRSFDTATSKVINYCKDMHGLPVIIHSRTADDSWRKESKLAIPLGVVCNTATWRWEWADGSSVDYKPTKPADADISANCNTGCVWYIFDGLWMKSCGNGTRMFAEFCTTQLPARPVSDDGDACGGFAANLENGLCYDVFTTPQDFSGAHAKCYDLGANHSSIHNHQENEFIRRLAVSKGAINGVSLGARVFYYTPPLEYLWGGDGSAFDYAYWQPGFPMESLGYCVSMDTLSSSGRWVNSNCESKMAYVCTRKRVASTRICPSGPWKEGEIITSPGFPFDASTACDYVLTAPSGKRVQVEIQILEANSCCDRLLILDNIVGGNVVADLTGAIENKTYSTKSSNVMRVAWMPNGGVNVRGLQMIFKAV